MGPSNLHSTSMTPLQEAAAVASVNCHARLNLTGRKTFKRYPLGYLHIDLTEIRTAEGKGHLFVAIDRTTKIIHAELYAQARQPSTSCSPCRTASTRS